MGSAENKVPKDPAAAEDAVFTGLGLWTPPEEEDVLRTPSERLSELAEKLDTARKMMIEVQKKSVNTYPVLTKWRWLLSRKRLGSEGGRSEFFAVRPVIGALLHGGGSFHGPFSYWLEGLSRTHALIQGRNDLVRLRDVVFKADTSMEMREFEVNKLSSHLAHAALDNLGKGSSNCIDPESSSFYLRGVNVWGSIMKNVRLGIDDLLYTKTREESAVGKGSKFTILLMKQVNMKDIQSLVRELEVEALTQLLKTGAQTVVSNNEEELGALFMYDKVWEGLWEVLAWRLAYETRGKGWECITNPIMEIETSLANPQLGEEIHYSVPDDKYVETLLSEVEETLRN